MPASLRRPALRAAILVSLFAVGTGSSAQADGGAEGLTLSVDGEANLLYIDRSHDRPSAGAGLENTMEIAIRGHRNGGAAPGWPAGPARSAPLMPGQLVQTGLGNVLSLTVAGDDNRVAMAQMGNGNRVHARIAGGANQALVIQHGANNRTGFAQSGQGNRIMVSQRSQ